MKEQRAILGKVMVVGSTAVVFTGYGKGSPERSGNGPKLFNPWDQWEGYQGRDEGPVGSFSKSLPPGSPTKGGDSHEGRLDGPRTNTKISSSLRNNSDKFERVGPGTLWGIAAQPVSFAGVER
jgi:hypothetical protein